MQSASFAQAWAWTWQLDSWTDMLDRAGSFAAATAILCLAAMVGAPVESVRMDASEKLGQAAPTAKVAAAEESHGRARDMLLAGYVAQPFYRPSDVHLSRPDGTDLRLESLGWDGDALVPPIDGGIRSVEWWGRAGMMIDFLHNKAVARLGRGAHGRKLANPVVDTVRARGTIAGQPAPETVLLTDLFERFEFTHGHNVLLVTPLVRLASFANITPYAGIGGGFALPHVEVWSAGDARDRRTNEYQLAGAAAQIVAGLDIRLGRFSWFIEYKLSWASISGALTGGHSWMNFDMPGDLLRQLGRWWRGEEPRLGRFSTTLIAHQVAGGVGYWVSRRAGATASSQVTARNTER